MGGDRMLSNEFIDEFHNSKWADKVSMVQTLWNLSTSTLSDKDDSVDLLWQSCGTFNDPMYEHIGIPPVEYGMYGLDSGIAIHIEKMVAKTSMQIPYDKIKHYMEDCETGEGDSLYLLREWIAKLQAEKVPEDIAKIANEIALSVKSQRG